jgi:uncharacterized protein (TIGR00251 family)
VVGLQPAEDGFLLGVRVTPGARRTRIQGVYGERLKVHISAPPEDNRANEELKTFLARVLDLPRDYVTLRAGHKSRDKTLLLRGLAEGELQARLQEALRPRDRGPRDQA